MLKGLRIKKVPLDDYRSQYTFYESNITDMLDVIRAKGLDYFQVTAMASGYLEAGDEKSYCLLMLAAERMGS